MRITRLCLAAAVLLLAACAKKKAPTEVDTRNTTNTTHPATATVVG